jgi:uncharacterized protein YutE (UPF0331/DUF86 family)
MVRADVAGQKVARALSRLQEAEALLASPAEAFLADTRGRDLASFYLFLAIQEAIDLAAHWVVDAGWGPPEDAASAFDLLAEHEAIPRTLADSLIGAVGLRNRIAHGYATVDHRRIQTEFITGATALREFLAAVARTAGL